jgi:hypothetical protein
MPGSDALSQPGNDRYEVTALLGRGGMGAVYRAFDREGGGAVALKRLQLAPDDSRRELLTDLFHQEFRSLVRLIHPHVVRAYDFGVDAHGPYYTMELVEGEGLHELAPLPYRQACALMRDAGSAIALLHSRRLLHRDLSPKNVQRTRDLRAKLLDFGAMAAMGPSRTLVGTPPFVPPEALQQSALDGRADLYALGGTLYYALTARHAFPARTIEQLPDLWRIPPAPPSTYARDVPPELDALVLALLNRNPFARPSSAAEVIERLSAIGKLGNDDQLAVSSAYVSTPELVGRNRQMSEVRSRLKGIETRGGALLIEGAAGFGRSRMLESAVIEAKLNGMALAQASAEDSAAGRYGVVRVLARALYEQLTEPDASGLHERAGLELLRAPAISAEQDGARRPELQATLIELLQTVSANQPLLVAVDDVDHCDEASQAALAAATRVCSHQQLLIAVTLTTGTELPPALRVLSEAATRIGLTGFAPNDTRALLSSVFGEVPNLHGLATRIHERAEGSPRGCMELAQHLVSHRIVSYHMGAWRLPEALDSAALPSSLSATRRSQLGALNADARELLDALAVADGSPLDLEACVELTSHGDVARVRAALDELRLAGLLRREDQRYALPARLWVELLQSELAPLQRQALSRRCAAMLTKRAADRLTVARYLWQAGDEGRTVDTLIAELTIGSRRDRCPQDYAEILLGAAEACGRLQRSRRERYMLLHELVRLGQNLSMPNMHAHMAELFAQLRHDSGLDDWEKLDPSLPAVPRLQQATEIAKQRQLAAPPSEQGLNVIEAIVALSRLIPDMLAIASQTGDCSMFELMPPLDAFFPLSPVIERIQRENIPAARHLIAGRYEDALALHSASLAKLESGGESLDETLRQWGICALHYALGCIEASFGRNQALHHADALEKAGGWVVPAWAIRRIYHLVVGNNREAEHCRKQIELLLLKSPIKPPLYAGSAHQHVYAYVMSDNVTGLRQVLAEMEELARAQPTLAPYVPFTRASHARACGNYAKALSDYDETLVQIRAGDHPLWAWAVSGRTAALLGLDRAREAREYAAGALKTARSLGLGLLRQHIEIHLALAEAKLGGLRLARERLDAISVERERLGIGGASIGWLYEVRARVAMWMRDSAEFSACVEKCGLYYLVDDPGLVAKYERLLQDARHYGLVAQAKPRLQRDASDDSSVAATIVSRLPSDGS